MIYSMITHRCPLEAIEAYWPLISHLPSEIFRIRTVDAAPASHQPDGCYDHTEIQKETKINENIVDIKKAKQR